MSGCSGAVAPVRGVWTGLVRGPTVARVRRAMARGWAGFEYGNCQAVGWAEGAASGGGASGREGSPIARSNHVWGRWRWGRGRCSRASRFESDGSPRAIGRGLGWGITWRWAYQRLLQISSREEATKSRRAQDRVKPSAPAGGWQRRDRESTIIRVRRVMRAGGRCLAGGSSGRWHGAAACAGRGIAGCRGGARLQLT